MVDKNKMQQAKQESRRGGQVEKRDEDISQTLERMFDKFKDALPPDTIKPESFIRMAMTALRTNPKLQQCSKPSLIGALMESAQAGLEPNSVMQEAWIIPYKNNKTGTYEAQFQMGYQGMMKLAWNSGLIADIDYDKVCENDVWEFEKGLNPKLRHIPADGERGEVTHFYAIAHTKDGGSPYVVHTAQEIEDHAKNHSQAYRSGYGPWVEYFEEMAIKTCLKELAKKKLPKKTTNEAIRMAQAASSDERTLRYDERTDQLVGDFDMPVDMDDDAEDAEVVEDDEAESTESPEKETESEKAEEDTSTKTEDTGAKAQASQDSSEGQKSAQISIDDVPAPSQIEKDTDDLKFHKQFEEYAKVIKKLDGDIADAVEEETSQRVLPDGLAPVTKSRIMEKVKHLHQELYELAQMEKSQQESQTGSSEGEQGEQKTLEV